MGFGSHYVTSPRWYFSAEDYKEWMNEQYNNNDDDEDDKEIIPKWF